MDKDNNWPSRENRAESNPKSPPVNFINITRRPEGGIVNIEMTRQPGSRPETESTSGNIGADPFFRSSKMPSLSSSMSSAFDDPFFKNDSFGINSLMKRHPFDNFGFANRAQSTDSNQSRLVINTPPRPINIERQTTGEVGSPYRVVIHPRSHSSDNVVVESSTDDAGTVTTTRHIISPKSVSSGNVSVLETKFPSLRTSSPFGQRQFLIQSPLFGDGSSRLSLFDRFNEHAPPSFFRSNPDNIHVSKVTVMRDGPQRSRVHNIPIKIEGRESSSHPRPSVVYKIPINLVNRNSEAKSSQPPLPIQVSLKPKGVSIPIITHRTCPSEAEEKLAQLTKQLEEEMKMTGATKQQQHMRQQIQQQQERDSIKQQEVLKQNQQQQQLYHQQQQPQIQQQQQFSIQPPIKEPPKPSLPDLANKSLASELAGLKIKSFKDDSKEAEMKKLLSNIEFKRVEALVEPKADVISKNEVNERVKESKILKDLQEKEVKEEEEEEKEEEDYLFGTCHTCEKEVWSDACVVLDRLYHCSCFTCSVCGRMMKGSMYYDVNGVVFCEQDYLKSGYSQVAEVCVACQQVVKDFLVKGARGKYHRECFRCSLCHCPLDEVPFSIDRHHNLLCLDHYYDTSSPTCFSCKKCIKPKQADEDVRKVLIEGKFLHEECYKCQDCDKRLGFTVDTGTYPLLNSLLLCRACSLKRERS